jgi:hypothetical protein
VNLRSPPRSLLGELTLLEIFDLFDEPILFSCRSSRGGLFVALLCIADDERQAWLYAPISAERLELLRGGRLTTYAVFRDVEGGELALVSRLRRVLEVEAPGWSVLWREAAQVEDSLLPTPGVSLELEPEEVGAGDCLPDVGALAAQARRDVLTLRLVLPNQHDHEAPASLVGAVLSGLQHVVNAIGQTVLDRPTTRAPIPAQVLRGCQMSVIGTFAGSFGVTLRGVEQADLFGATKAGPVLERLVGLLSVTPDAAALREQLGVLGGRLPTKYRELLATLGAVERFELVWGAPVGGAARRVVLARDDVAAGARVLTSYSTHEPQEFTVLARLIGLNLRTKSYELFDEAERVRYAGRFVEAATAVASGARLSGLYSALLRETQEESAAGAVELRHELLALACAEE